MEDNVTFPTSISSKVKKKTKMHIFVLSCLQAVRENNVYVAYCFIEGNRWQSCFLISKRVFTDFSLTTQIFHMPLHTKLLKYDSTSVSGSKISMCLKKVCGVCGLCVCLGVMRLRVGRSTFNYNKSKQSAVEITMLLNVLMPIVALCLYTDHLTLIPIL